MRSDAEEASTGTTAAIVSTGAATRNQRLSPVARSSVMLVRLAIVTS